MLFINTWTGRCGGLGLGRLLLFIYKGVVKAFGVAHIFLSLPVFAAIRRWAWSAARAPVSSCPPPSYLYVQITERGPKGRRRKKKRLQRRPCCTKNAFAVLPKASPLLHPGACLCLCGMYTSQFSRPKQVSAKLRPPWPARPAATRDHHDRGGRYQSIQQGVGRRLWGLLRRSMAPWPVVVSPKPGSIRKRDNRGSRRRAGDRGRLGAHDRPKPSHKRPSKSSQFQPWKRPPIPPVDAPSTLLPSVLGCLGRLMDAGVLKGGLEMQSAVGFNSTTPPCCSNRQADDTQTTINSIGCRSNRIDRTRRSTSQLIDRSMD